MDTLSPIEIDIGRKVVSCSRTFWTHLIFLFRSTIMPSPARFEVLTAQFVFRYVFMEDSASYPPQYVSSHLQLTETASLCLQLSRCSPFQNCYHCHSIHRDYRSKLLLGDVRTTSHLPSNINFNWTQHSHR